MEKRMTEEQRAELVAALTRYAQAHYQLAQHWDAPDAPTWTRQLKEAKQAVLALIDSFMTRE
jgi:hypothetical protein